MKLSLLDLVKEVGVENITVEPLPKHITGAELIKIGKGKNKTTVTKVEFLTKQMTPDDLVSSGSPPMCGMMIWIPTELFKKAREKFDALPDEPETEQKG